MRPLANMLFGVAASLSLANAALAESIGLPSCQDQATGSSVVLSEDFQNGQRIFDTTDAQEKRAVVLADCTNGFALQVRDRRNWFYGDTARPGVTLYDRPGQVRAYLAGAVRSQETHSWDDLRRSLTRDGYLVQTSSLNISYCGCQLSW